MYEAFLAELDGLRSRTARFRRVALHLHSPDSYDWAKGAIDTTRNDRARFGSPDGATIFNDELRLHFDLVAITDHMKSGFACKCSAEAVPNDQFLVLPGMEVNLRLEPPLGFARIHLLTLLPEGSTAEAFARLFHGQAGIPDDANRTGNEEVRGLSLTQWVERVHGERGLCIAAHVENNQGVRHWFRQSAKETLTLISEDTNGRIEQENEVPENFREYILRSKVDAIEVHRSDHIQHYRWHSKLDGKQRWIACTLTFDAHSIEHFAKAERVTHIKMTRLGLNGLRQALLLPDNRIRFHDNLPEAPTPRLLGIQFKGGSSSFFEDETIAFAENLTCVIGVRGSGKSTVVEGLRYTFGYNRSLGDLGKLEVPIKDLQRANLTDALIKVAYQTTSGEVFLLSATYDPKSDYVTKVYRASGEQVELADVETCGHFPLRLFGWNEIETLGREPAKQRELLDRVVAELCEPLAERDRLRALLVENRGEVEKHIQSVRAAYSSGNSEIRRYKEFKTDFERQNTPEVQQLFTTLDLAQDKLRVLNQVSVTVQVAVDALENIGAISLGAGVEDILQNASEDLRLWWHEEALLRLGIGAAQQEAQAGIQQAVQRLNALTSVNQQYQRSLEGARDKVQQDLRERFAENDDMQRIADLRQNAESRLRKVSATRQLYLKAFESLKASLQVREGICKQLNAVQDQIAGIRAKKNSEVETILNQFLPDWMRVTIKLEPGRDTEEFGKSLYKIFGARSGQRKRICAIAQAASTPLALSAMGFDGDFKGLVGKSGTLIDGTSCKFEQEDAEECTARLTCFEHDELADVTVLSEDSARLNTLLDLQETHWDDLEAILLNGDPVNAKSPGQRSSAMLPLIALAESTPLVIDQPEDNLDKRLIGSVLMKVLSSLKEKRQIIVCTHDPNILVGGDAEQVVVLEADSDRKGTVKQHGSIDNDDIVETVLDVLEGGAEAFDTRRERYAGHVSQP